MNLKRQLRASPFWRMLIAGVWGLLFVGIASCSRHNADGPQAESNAKHEEKGALPSSLANLTGKAQKEQKSILLLFVNPDESPSQRVIENIGYDASLKAIIQRNYVLDQIKNNPQDERVAYFGIHQYPTFLILTPEGLEFNRITGFQTAQYLQTALRRSAPSLSASTNPALESQDIQQSFYRAEKALGAKDYKGALSEYLLILGTSKDAGMRNDVMGRMANLGKKYPPAKTALQKQRDAFIASADIKNLSPSEAMRYDDEVMRYNSLLGESGKNIELYQGIPATLGRERERMFRRLFGTMVKARDYDMITSEWDLESLLYEHYSAQSWLSQVKVGTSVNPYTRENVQNDKNYQAQTMCAIEALLGASDAASRGLAKAQRICSRYLEAVIDTKDIRQEFAYAAGRAQTQSARSFVDWLSNFKVESTLTLSMDAPPQADSQNQSSSVTDNMPTDASIATLNSDERMKQLLAEHAKTRAEMENQVAKADQLIASARKKMADLKAFEEAKKAQIDAQGEYMKFPHDVSVLSNNPAVQKARAYLAQKKFKEALDEYRQILDGNPPFALKYWLFVELDNVARNYKYAPARDELERRSELLMENMNPNQLESVDLVMKLNSILGDEEKNVAVYKMIPQTSPVKKMVFGSVFFALVKNHEYDVIAGSQDLESWVDGCYPINYQKRGTRMPGESAETESQPLNEKTRKWTLAAVETLLGTGAEVENAGAEARRICARYLDTIDDTKETKEAFASIARKIGNAKANNFIQWIENNRMASFNLNLNLNNQNSNI